MQRQTLFHSRTRSDSFAAFDSVNDVRSTQRTHSLATVSAEKQEPWFL